MNRNEDKLSSYIDSLNEEIKPNEYNPEMDESEMEDLFETVRLVRSLKEPALPNKDFQENLVTNINKTIFKDKYSNKIRKRWFMDSRLKHFLL